MRRITRLMLPALAVLAVLGCKHVGGKCDCGPAVGEASTYAPNLPSANSYMASPGIIAPVSDAPSTGTYESINPPKELPKK